MIGTSEKWTYAYDNRNQLVEAKHYDAMLSLVLTAEYKYDLFGNRNEKAVTDSGGTTTTRFALNGWNPALLPRPPGEGLGVRDPSAPRTSTSSPTSTAAVL